MIGRLCTNSFVIREFDIHDDIIEINLKVQVQRD